MFFSFTDQGAKEGESVPRAQEDHNILTGRVGVLWGAVQTPQAGNRGVSGRRSVRSSVEPAADAEERQPGQELRLRGVLPCCIRQPDCFQTLLPRILLIEIYLTLQF